MRILADTTNRIAEGEGGSAAMAMTDPYLIACLRGGAKEEKKCRYECSHGSTSPGVGNSGRGLCETDAHFVYGQLVSGCESQRNPSRDSSVSGFRGERSCTGRARHNDGIT